jgi:NitT/TauT family transport system substrate-binding protein
MLHGGCKLRRGQPQFERRGWIMPSSTDCNLRRIVSTALFVLPLLAGLTSLSKAAELIPFNFGISAPVVTILPVWMAQSAGFYEKEGLKVEVINMEGGSKGIQVLLSGNIQGMHVGVAPIVLANKAGADLRAITSTINTIPFTIFTKPEIKTANDLKGKDIGISSFGAETDIAVTLMLQKFGMDRKDVTISQLGGSSKRLGALIAGRIDAVPLIEPTVTIAKEKGFNPLMDLAAANTPWIFDSVVVTKEYLQQHPDIVSRFVKAYVRAAYLVLSDEKAGKAEIAKRFKTQDAKVIDATYADFKRTMPLDAAPSIEGAKNVIAQLQLAKFDIGSTDPDAYLDFSIINALKKDGYFAQMKKEYPVK